VQEEIADAMASYRSKGKPPVLHNSAHGEYLMTLDRVILVIERDAIDPESVVVVDGFRTDQ